MRMEKDRESQRPRPFLSENRIKVMGGMTISSPLRGVLPHTTVSKSARELLTRAMTRAQVSWGGKACPDCNYAQTTRQEALRALLATRRMVEDNPELYTLNGHRWPRGQRSRDVLLSVLNDMILEMSYIDDLIVVIEDDYLLCKHPNF